MYLLSGQDTSWDTYVTYQSPCCPEVCIYRSCSKLNLHSFFLKCKWGLNEGLMACLFVLYMVNSDFISVCAFLAVSLPKYEIKVSTPVFVISIYSNEKQNIHVRFIILFPPCDHIRYLLHEP